jgi:Tfp pilus assembly protein PilO
MSSQLRSKNTIIALALGGAVLLAVVVWFLLVSPERSKVGKLDTEIASVQNKIQERKQALASPSAQVHIRASDSYRLSRAMPNQADMPGVLLALNRLTAKRGLNLNGIQPSTQVVQTGFLVQPLEVTLEGRFSAVSGFLSDIRRLVRVQHHRLKASGRMFSVDQIDLTVPDARSQDSSVKPGMVTATITVDAFLFTGGALASPTTPSTPSASSGTVAAGATP